MATTPPVYTAKEILSILDKAKEAGVRFVKVPGFEATWDLHVAQPKAQAAQPDRAPDPLGDYVTTFGKYKGRPLREIPKGDIREYGEFLLRDMDREDLGAKAREWVDKAEEFLRRAQA